MRKILVAFCLCALHAAPSWGGTCTNQIFNIADLITQGPWIDARAYSTLALADAAAVAAGKTLLISSNWPVTSNTTLSSAIQIINGGMFTISSGQTLTINGPFSAPISQVFTGTGTITGLKEVYPEWFGEVVTDAGATINKALVAVTGGGSIELTKATYPITTKIAFPAASTNIKLFSKVGSAITVAGTIDCIDLTSTNENYGGHILEGLTLTGPNSYYGSDMDNSDGAGVRMQRADGDTTNVATAYNTVIRDCLIQGFEYGLRMQSALKTHVEGRTWLRFNNYGIYFDGGSSNANNFDGTLIEYNAIAGVYSAGTTGGGLTDATSNVFKGCLFESNNPYGATSGHGVELIRSYDFIFDSCYFEANYYAVELGAYTQGNRFINNRFAPGSGLPGTIYLSDAGAIGNTFEGNTYISSDTTTPTVVTVAGQYNNQFLDNIGFNFIQASLGTMPFIRNNTSYSTIYGTRHSLIARTSEGYLENVGEGTTPGTMAGIGTATAVLHCFGYTEISFGEQVAAAGTPTTITTLEGVTPGQILVLRNSYSQFAHPVTIAGVAIITKTAAVLTYGLDTIVFYIINGGIALEIGRNF